jgi:hypothetical protein
LDGSWFGAILSQLGHFRSDSDLEREMRIHMEWKRKTISPEARLSKKLFD